MGHRPDIADVGPDATGQQHHGDGHSKDRVHLGNSLLDSQVDGCRLVPAVNARRQKITETVHLVGPTLHRGKAVTVSTASQNSIE